MSNYIRAISKNGGIVVCAVDSTNIVREMERIHRTSAVVSAALGRVLTSACLMGSWLKSENDSLTLRVDGGGPAGVVLAVCDGGGNVRGYAQHPRVEVPLCADGKLNVGSVVGRDGTLSVVKDLGLKEPYIGYIPLVSGEIAEDVTAYYAKSEQTPTACAVGVLVEKDLSIRAAGGYLLQLLPGASEAEVAALEKNIAAMPVITEFLDGGGTVPQMVQMALNGFNPNILEERTVEYKCHCSREKSLDILVSLGKEELERMRLEDETAQVECHFCDKKYVYELDEVLKGMGE